MYFPVRDEFTRPCRGQQEIRLYVRIGKNDASAAGVFYGKFGLAILTCDATLKNNGVSATCKPS
jgi:hypothetical protein